MGKSFGRTDFWDHLSGQVLGYDWSMVFKAPKWSKKLLHLSGQVLGYDWSMVFKAPKWSKKLLHNQSICIQKSKLKVCTFPKTKKKTSGSLIFFIYSLIETKLFLTYKNSSYTNMFAIFFASAHQYGRQVVKWMN